MRVAAVPRPATTSTGEVRTSRVAAASSTADATSGQARSWPASSATVAWSTARANPTSVNGSHQQAAAIAATAAVGRLEAASERGQAQETRGHDRRRHDELVGVDTPTEGHRREPDDTGDLRSDQRLATLAVDECGPGQRREGQGQTDRGQQRR